MSVNALMEDSIRIAWDYLERTGQIDDPEFTSNFLLQYVEHAVRMDERRQLMLTNRAIGLRTAQAAQGGIVRPSASKEGRRRAVCLRYLEQGPRAFYRADTV